MLWVLKRWWAAVLDDERGDLQQWLPILIGIGIAVALLIGVYEFANGNLPTLLQDLWNKITNP